MFAGRSAAHSHRPGWRSLARGSSSGPLAVSAGGRSFSGAATLALVDQLQTGFIEQLRQTALMGAAMAWAEGPLEAAPSACATHITRPDEPPK